MSPLTAMDYVTRARLRGYGADALIDITTLANAADLLRAEVERLEGVVARLTHERDEIRIAERALSDAYLRLRRLLGPYGSFDTPTAPTGPEVWATTELALQKLLGTAPPSDPT